MYVNEKYDCPYVFVCGDLNSRAADRNNYCDNDVPDENSDIESEGGGRKSTEYKQGGGQRQRYFLRYNHSVSTL